MLAVAPPDATAPQHLMQAMRSLEAIFLVGVEGVTEVLLVRHADCYRNLTDVIDPPLSSVGREQARRLAQRVNRHQHAVVYSSPLRRATETAQAITDDFTTDNRLVEMALEISDDGALDFKESHDSAVARMRGVVNDVVRAHEGNRVILVCHAASIVACLTDVMRLGPGQLRLLPYYTSISTVRVLGDRQMIAALGDTAHLE
jgi:2,3-bisphosphoglycerate-dependent phosphoglycerate mutase